MGTEVQSKMYLPGYYSLKDLNDKTGNGCWPLHHENKTIGQYYDVFLTRPTREEYVGYGKEQLRQTILKHESIFRHQLHELHRIYNVQRDMMDEIRSKELDKHLIPVGTSQSNLFSYGFPCEDKERCHIPYPSLVDLNCGRLSMSGAESIQSHFSSMKGKIMQSGCCPTQNGLRLKHSECLESQCKKLQRKLFDLELPADDYINNEEEGQGVSGVSQVESHPLNRRCEVTRESDGNLSLRSGVSSGCNGDALSSNLYIKRSHGLTDLNEPIQVEDESGSAAVDNQGNISCSKEEIQRRNLSVNSYLGFQPHKGRDGGVYPRNLHLETEMRQKGWLSYNFETGQVGSKESSFLESFQPGDLPTPFKSPHVEHRKAHERAEFPLSAQNKTQPQIKRTIFGGEISERNHGASTVASYKLGPHPIVPQSHVANSESSSISSWKTLPNGFSQNLMSVQGNPYSSTFAQSSKSSITVMHSPEFIKDKLFVSSNSRSVPSLRAEVPYHNDPCHGSQLESMESWVCHPSTAFGYPNGIVDRKSASEQFTQHGPKNNFRDLGCKMDAKSAEYMNVGAVPLNCYQNEVISPPGLVSIDGSAEQENSHRALPWLRAVPRCNGKFSTEREGSSMKNLDSSHNYFKEWEGSSQKVNRTEVRNGPTQSFIQDSSSATCALDSEHRKLDVGDSSISKKILGFSIFEKSHISKDLPSPSDPSKPNCHGSAVHGADSVRLFNTNLACDPLTPKSGQECKAEGLVLEKGLLNHSVDLRHQIDLNLSVTEERVEEEVRPTLSSSRTNSKIADEIDLEAPDIVEPEIGITGGESLESKLTEPCNSIHDESGEPQEGIFKTAAETLLAISSFCVHNLQDNAYYHQKEASLSDSLQWFADIISTYKGDIMENEVGSVLTGKDCACHEESIPDGFDYFEFMTLNLTETKVEEYCHKPQGLETPKTENPLSRRLRRGQARRGRQQKDFQRDILPSLASLSRNEVIKDIHTIEGVVRESGGTWQSGLAQRNTAKSGRVSGRRRSGGSAPSPMVTTISPPQLQQPESKELGLGERTLAGWGKRTRRPPRQRCLINNPPQHLK